MKKLFILLILCLSSLTLFSCNKNNYNKALEFIQNKDYEKAKETLENLNGYKGSEELLKNFYYVPVNKIISFPRYQTKYKYEYDSNNILSKIKNITIDGEELSSQSFIIENDYLVKEVFNTNSESISQCIEYEYDETGRIKKKIDSLPDNNIKTTTSYIYDNDGNLIKESYSLDYNGEVSNYPNITYTYDEKGNLIKEEIIKSEDTYEIHEYTYNENFQIISKSSTFTASSSVTQFQYDDSDNLSKEIRTSNNGETYLINYYYNPNNKVIRIEHKKESSNGFDSTFDYTYTNDCLTKIIHTTGEGITTYEWEYKLVYIDVNFPLYMYEHCIIEI